MHTTNFHTAPRGASLLRVLAPIALLAFGITLQGCSLYSWAYQGVVSRDKFEQVYGTTVVSEPLVVGFDSFVKELDLTVAGLKFDAALAEAGKTQSAAFRRRQVSQEAGLRMSADILKAAQLAAALAAGVPPPAGSTTPPPLPTVTPLTANTTFQAGALGNVSTTVPLGRRIQTALNNLMLQRLGTTSFDLLKKNAGKYDMHIAISTMTVIPGEKTKFNSTAEIRTRWESAPASGTASGTDFDEKEIIVVPIYPLYDSVSELNDSASLDEFRLFLAALLQAGPIQGQGQYQRLTSDVRRLVSASERVTLLGAPVLNDVSTYRISGTRVARPFDELRPKGTHKLEPLTIPLVSVVLVNKESLKSKTMKIGMEYSGRWRRDRPLWDKLPVLGSLQGLLYDQGTKFRDPGKKEPCRIGDLFKSDAPIKNGTWTVAKFDEVFTAKLGKKDTALHLSECSATNITNPFTQVVTVLASGSPPKHMFLNGIELDFKKPDGKKFGDISTPAKAEDLVREAMISEVPAMTRAGISAAEQSGAETKLKAAVSLPALFSAGPIAPSELVGLVESEVGQIKTAAAFAGNKEGEAAEKIANAIKAKVMKPYLVLIPGEVIRNLAFASNPEGSGPDLNVAATALKKIASDLAAANYPNLHADIAGGFQDAGDALENSAVPGAAFEGPDIKAGLEKAANGFDAEATKAAQAAAALRPPKQDSIRAELTLAAGHLRDAAKEAVSIPLRSHFDLSLRKTSVSLLAAAKKEPAAAAWLTAIAKGLDSVSIQQYDFTALLTGINSVGECNEAVELNFDLNTLEPAPLVGSPSLSFTLDESTAGIKDYSIKPNGRLDWPKEAYEVLIGKKEEKKKKP